MITAISGKAIVTMAASLAALTGISFAALTGSVVIQAGSVEIVLGKDANDATTPIRLKAAKCGAGECPAFNLAWRT